MASEEPLYEIRILKAEHNRLAYEYARAERAVRMLGWALCSSLAATVLFGSLWFGNSGCR